MILHSIEGIQIRQFTWNLIDANSFLLTEGAHGLLIDAVYSPELFDALSAIDDLIIILTHCHFDHICGLNQIRECMPYVLVYASKKCSENIGNPFRNMSSSADVFWTFYKNRNQYIKHNDVKYHIVEPFICAPTDLFFEGETVLKWRNHKITLTQYGGHTNDSLIAVIDNKYMFSGDTLLPIPTVTRFPSGNTSQFWKETIPKLKNMAVDLVFPGHGMPGELTAMIAANEKRRTVY